MCTAYIHNTPISPKTRAFHPVLFVQPTCCLCTALEQRGRSFQAFRSLAPPVEGDRLGFGKLRAVNEQFAKWMIYHLPLSKRKNCPLYSLYTSILPLWIVYF